MSNGHRWSKFWWQDWQGDKALSRCSLAARGLWIELLCIAHEGEPYGHLRLNGHGLDAGEIADMITKTTAKEVAKLLAELEQKGVFSRTHDGTIYSRRMQRDGKQSEVGREAATRRWGGSGTAHPNGWPNGLPIGSGIGYATREAIAHPNALEADTDSESEAEEESKKVLDSSSLSFPCCTHEREPEAVSAVAEPSDGFVTPVEDRVDPVYVETTIAKLGRSLRGVAYAPGRSGLSREEQIEALTPSRPRQSLINPELLRLMPHRQRALAAAGRR